MKFLWIFPTFEKCSQLEKFKRNLFHFGSLPNPKIRFFPDFPTQNHQWNSRSFKIFFSLKKNKRYFDFQYHTESCGNLTTHFSMTLAHCTICLVDRKNKGNFIFHPGNFFGG